MNLKLPKLQREEKIGHAAKKNIIIHLIQQEIDKELEEYQKASDIYLNKIKKKRIDLQEPKLLYSFLVNCCIFYNQKKYVYKICR